MPHNRCLIMGLIPPLIFGFCVRKPTPVAQGNSRRDLTTPTPKREELYMEEKTVHTTEKQIGDTIYIVESAFSSNAKESAYDKLKRLILNDTNSVQIKKVS